MNLILVIIVNGRLRVHYCELIIMSIINLILTSLLIIIFYYTLNLLFKFFYLHFNNLRNLNSISSKLDYS